MNKMTVEAMMKELQDDRCRHLESLARMYRAFGLEVTPEQLHQATQ